MRKNVFRLVDKRFSPHRHYEVAAMLHGRDYGFKQIFIYPPNGFDTSDPSLVNIFIHPLCGGTIVFRDYDVDGKDIVLEQWTGKKWVKVHAHKSDGLDDGLWVGGDEE